MIYGGIADEVRLEAEEFGWELVVETDHDVFRFRVHGIVEDIIKAGKQAEDYLAEGRMAATMYEIDLAQREQREAYDRMVGNA